MMPTILKTDNYSVFKKIKGNRRVGKTHKNNLVRAISEDASCISYNPIIVNDKNEVIDGQHRLSALEELNLPVYYIKVNGLTLKNVQMLNALSKSWTPMEYAKSFSDLGNSHYQGYIDFKKTYKLNHDVLLRYLSLGKPMTSDMFKKGKFEITNPRKSEDLCKRLNEVGRFYKGFKRRTFAFAFQSIWENPEYDHERMLLKLSKTKKEIGDYATKEEYLYELDKIYNHGLGEKKIKLY